MLLENVNNYVLLIITLFACLGGNILKKLYTNNTNSCNKSVFLYNFIVSFVCMLSIFLLNGFNIKISTFTIILGVVFGIVTLIQQLTNLQALKCGPLSYTSVIMSLASIIPTFYGVIFKDDKLNTFKIIGIIFMVVCFFLSVNTTKEEKKANLKWFILSIIATIATGAIGILQVEHQSSNHKNELSMFLCIAFFVSGLVSLILYLTSKSGSKVFLENSFPKTKTKFWTIIISTFVFSGIFAGLNNVINLFLSGNMSSVILFPILNGGGLILVVLTSFILFKEKLTLKQCIGIICGIISVILLCL